MLSIATVNQKIVEVKKLTRKRAVNARAIFLESKWSLSPRSSDSLSRSVHFTKLVSLLTNESTSVNCALPLR